ncbi:unnamed protein product [Ranitomeya imitator]|uniref:Uncharacterized protein n=1 Tax=Ranitomeya imitator TaxID=111125 RepID=A0ABN9L5J9_9NEOB|nr:unnamed protein product [Ranitomeya imitator]
MEDQVGQTTHTTHGGEYDRPRTTHGGQAAPPSSASLNGEASLHLQDSHDHAGHIRGVHHTEGTACSSQSACITQAKNIQNYHMSSNGWCDIGYK